jgi:hypothetical protein
MIIGLNRVKSIITLRTTSAMEITERPAMAQLPQHLLEVVLALIKGLIRMRLCCAPVPMTSPGDSMKTRIAEWEKFMRQFIYISTPLSPRSGGKKQIFSPPNYIAVKLAHHESNPNPSVPQLDVYTEIPRIIINMDRLQILQLSAIVKRFSLLHKRRHLSLFRPSRYADGGTSTSYV